MENIYAKPITADTFEFVFLRDHPGRIVSNSDDPPKSFHSRDIFTPHKTISGAWKYLGRLDDRVTLMNGEEVLPLPIEGSVRRHELVREAVVFGIGRTIPGLLVFRSQTAKDLEDKHYIEEIWPIVDAANRVAEGFSQIGIDMIVPMPAGMSIPLTDKRSVIRAQVYNVFEKEIEDAYVRLEQRQEGTMIMDGAELETHLLKTSQQILGQEIFDPGDDLLTLGMTRKLPTRPSCLHSFTSRVAELDPVVSLQHLPHACKTRLLQLHLCRTRHTRSGADSGSSNQIPRAGLAHRICGFKTCRRANRSGCR